MSCSGFPPFILTAFFLVVIALAPLGCTVPGKGNGGPEAPTGDDQRMAWWREARFGLFIHWGLYAIPAGEWKGETNHAEWIRHTARIPVEEYDRFVGRFNPTQFDADAWARMAKDAGMKYIVITSKHHDGFCLFDSKFTDYDVMSTPFKRDILKELSEACRRHGLKMCWYHSIMDWHHPDYLPRRPWEERPAEGADFQRYIQYMKNQLRELTTNYREIGVLWFDGEWESTWTHEHGKDLYEYVRGLQPSIIINNRVDVGRAGMEGMSKAGKYVGDFGTPEQQIPATGLPGVDWETCMTMNRHWGHNKNDHNWKSDVDLIRKLADIASKGGNFLLNVGPTAEGRFPEPCIERLESLGRWMKANGESIHGTTASPFKELPFGRCTKKRLSGEKWRLYLHVFDWPADRKLVVPGLDNEVKKAWFLAGDRDRVKVTRRNLDLLLELPSKAPDPANSVVVLDIAGRPVVIEPPRIETDSFMIVDRREVRLVTDVPRAEIRFTLDGSPPGPDSRLYRGSLTLNRTAVLKARLFRNGEAISEAAEAAFEQVEPRPAAAPARAEAGLRYAYYEGEWNQLPDFDRLDPAASGVTPVVDIGLRQRDERFGFRFMGFVKVPATGLYRFFADSDDGSRLYIGEVLLIDNDGLHSPREMSGEIALEAGLHPITVAFFECTGNDVLDVSVEGPGMAKQPIPESWLFHE